ncbi:hypothetical protein WJX81_004553 [Elliptochloris bilobata]|uniref:Peptidase M48 domain-containing protein n=1 Tax=Elliptochloris bilobata TaxID=381761 RepID=A0AAW1SDM5_9CHLO
MVSYVRSRQEVPYTHRRHAIFISVEAEKRLGEAAFQQEKDDAQRKGTLLPSTHSVSQLVKRVGDRIIQKVVDGQGGGYQEHLKDLDWEYAVIKSDTMNAGVLPGGKIIVYTGLLKVMDRKDELAAVLGHEAGHVIARHHAERVSRLSLVFLLRLAFLIVFQMDLPPGLADIAFNLPNSRAQEEEADVIGMSLAARACYEPGAAMTVFTRLGAVEKKMGLHVIPAFLRTHPLSEVRVQKLQKHLPEARHWAELEEPKPASDDPFDF